MGGSIASSFQGDPRATNDIDFVLDLPIGLIDRLVAALGPDFEVDTDMPRDALMHGRSCNIFYLPIVMKVGIFAVGPDPFDEVEFSRRRPVVVRDRQTLVLKSPEDTVLRKLLWYRAGDCVSDTQWRDVVAVLRVSGAELDYEYMSSWAGRLKISELLNRARSEANEVA